MTLFSSATRYGLLLAVLVVFFGSPEAYATPAYTADAFCRMKESGAVSQFDSKHVRITGVVSSVNANQLDSKYATLKVRMKGKGKSCFKVSFAWWRDPNATHRGRWNGQTHILNFRAGSTISFTGKWSQSQGVFRTAKLD